MIDDQNTLPTNPTAPTNPLDALAAQTPPTPPTPSEPTIDPNAQADLNQALVGLGTTPAVEAPAPTVVGPEITIESPLDKLAGISPTPPSVAPINLTEHPIEETGPQPLPGVDHPNSLADHSPLSPVTPETPPTPPTMPAIEPAPVAPPPPIADPITSGDKKELEAKAKDFIQESGGLKSKPAGSMKKVGAITGGLIALALTIGGTLVASGYIQIPGIGEVGSRADSCTTIPLNDGSGFTEGCVCGSVWAHHGACNGSESVGSAPPPGAPAPTIDPNQQYCGNLNQGCCGPSGSYYCYGGLTCIAGACRSQTFDPGNNPAATPQVTPDTTNNPTGLKDENCPGTNNQNVGQTWCNQDQNKKYNCTAAGWQMTGESCTQDNGNVSTNTCEGTAVACSTFNCPQGDTNGDGQCTTADEGANNPGMSDGTDCAAPASGCGQVDLYTQKGNWSSWCGTTFHSFANCSSNTTTDDGGGDTVITTQALVCQNLTSSTASPKLGDSVTFTCNASASNVTIGSYEFRYKIGTGAFQNLPASSTTIKQSAALTVSQPGAYQVQCRACKDATTCTPWSSVN